jgi:hypothetical protein
MPGYTPMWHYAKIDENNIVVAVMTINNQDGEDEAHGAAICEQLTDDPGPWIKGAHTDGLFRKVGPGRGMTWDPDRDGFIPKKRGPYGALWESWVVNETTLHWEPPIGYPDGYDEFTAFFSWIWDEDNVAWISVPQIDLDTVTFPEGESRLPD